MCIAYFFAAFADAGVQLQSGFWRSHDFVEDLDVQLGGRHLFRGLKDLLYLIGVPEYQERKWPDFDNEGGEAAIFFAIILSAWNFIRIIMYIHKPAEVSWRPGQNEANSMKNSRNPVWESRRRFQGCITSGCSIEEKRCELVRDKRDDYNGDP